MKVVPQSGHRSVQVALFGAIVCAVLAMYYLAFYFPPRLVGVSDPDRFYHLALSQLISAEGILRTLPQVDDLGWGRYFPDKEFLFHVLTGLAHRLGGQQAVMLVVPVLGLSIGACLYATLARVLAPSRAAILVLLTLLLSSGLLFRLTLLRPHMLAVLFFCLLLFAILRGRSWLAAAAGAGFALSYHAYYIPMLVIAIAATLRWSVEPGGARRWQWAAAGLVLGIVLNPYFPSTLVMTLSHLKIALGIGLPAGLGAGQELRPLGLVTYLDGFGLLPLVLLGATTLLVRQRLKPTPENAGIWFLFLLSMFLTLLSLKNIRAAEYAIPSAILLAGYGLARLEGVNRFVLACLLLAGAQLHSAWTYYRDIWSRPQDGNSAWFLAAANLLPAEADGKKVFNCEWAAGSYLLYAKPRVRFVDLLDPAFLWLAAPDKHAARERLRSGMEPEPRLVLGNVFKADYVLCAAPMLNRQLLSDPGHFEPIVGAEPTGPLLVFRIRD